MGIEVIKIIASDDKAIIGLHEAVEALIDVGEKCEKCYKHCGTTPPPILIDLAKHNGQTTLTRFYSRVLKQTYGIPSGGLDDFLEFSVNGDMKSLKEIRRKLVQAAVYTNTYHGVAAFDITGLADYINENQIEFFLHDVLQGARDASVLFFVAPAELNRMSKLIAELRNTMGNLNVVRVSPYTAQEYAEIVTNNLAKLGVSLEVEDVEAFRLLMQEVVQSTAIRSAKDTELVAKKLTEYADYSSFRPVFNMPHLRHALNDLSNSRGEGYYGER